MTTIRLSARIGDPRSFAMDIIEHRRVRRPWVLRGLRLVLGLLCLAGARPVSPRCPLSLPRMPMRHP